MKRFLMEDERRHSTCGGSWALLVGVVVFSSQVPKDPSAASDGEVSEALTATSVAGSTSLSLKGVSFKQDAADSKGNKRPRSQPFQCF